MASQDRQDGPGDRDDRRSDVSRATARIIAEQGLDGVKLRSICADLGYSTHLISHYFENKKELILFTLRQCAARQAGRLKAAIARKGSLADCLEALLPLDEERTIDARVWMVFWAQTSDPDIAAVQRDFGARWRRLLNGMMRMRGFFPAGFPRDRQDFVAQRLQTTVAGIGVHGALGVWSPDRQRQHLETELAAILSSLDEDRPASPVPAPHAAPPEAGQEGYDRELALENARLRKMLIDAMLQIETLTEQQSIDGTANIRRLA